MEDYAVYNSPFRSSVFQTSNCKTVREVYRERIKEIYHSQFPLLQNINIEIQTNLSLNEQKDKEDTKEEKKENIESNKDEKQVENVDEKSEEKTTPKIEKIDNEQDIALNKFKHALNLLDNEYFGAEQELYLLLFNKYINNNNKQIAKPEYLPISYSTPLISELLITEHKRIECSECLQSYSLNEFALDEINYNGYYLACGRCAPDRNNIISLKWHEIFKSDSVIFENNKYVAKVIQSNHRYCVAAQRPVIKGIHCWRWCTKQYQSWFLWGISHCKKYTDNSYGNQGVYGIAGSNQSYKNGQCSYEIQTGIFFGGKTKVLIDMLLDLNKGQLKFRIPGNDTEAIMTNIPKDSQQGWVPHCNIHYQMTTVQVKKIPTTWYGKMPKRVKFDV